MTSDDAASFDEVKLALDHAWAWFNLHGTQRMQMLNFWLVSIAFLTGAFVAAITNEAFGAAFGVAVAGGVASSCFYRLERRTRLLVRLAETPLAELQKYLAGRTNIAGLDMLTRADTDKAFFTSYGVVIRSLEWFAIGAFTVAAIVSAKIWLGK